MKRTMIRALALVTVLTVARGLGRTRPGAGRPLQGAAASPVADAAQARDRTAVANLLRQAADVNAAQADGMTALHWAALNDDAALAETLLYAGANVKATTRLNAYTPLLLAAKDGRAAVIDPLVKAGADVNG